MTTGASTAPAASAGERAQGHGRGVEGGIHRLPGAKPTPEIVTDPPAITDEADAVAPGSTTTAGHATSVQAGGHRRHRPDVAVRGQTEAERSLGRGPCPLAAVGRDPRVEGALVIGDGAELGAGIALQRREEGGSRVSSIVLPCRAEGGGGQARRVAVHGAGAEEPA